MKYTSSKSLKTGVGSRVGSGFGSISQKYGYEDPDPHQNVTDTLIKMIMQQICIRRTEDCLKQNMEKLDQLAELLLKKETLNYQDVEDLLGP
jgi:ATP-dependent Zn protease